MGYLNALGIAESDIPLEQQVRWHLQYNHYPPVPESMVEVALTAIDHAIEEDWGADIALPEGILYKGEETAPTYAIISNFHLEPFINQEEAQ